MKVKNLSSEIMGRTLFEDISLEINSGEKVGLIGPNGSGKTTLLNTILKDAYGEKKYVKFLDNEILGYFKQEANFKDLSLTIEEYIKKELKITELTEKLKELELKLDCKENLEEYSNLQNKFLSMDGYNFDYQLKKVLNGFALINKKDFKLEELSGGERSKVLLAKTILEQPSLMFLDEPTNNLDIKSLEWLEKYLKDSTSSMLIVSHDRKFLDNIVNRIIEIDSNKKTIIQYSGNYSEYKEYKEQERRSAEENYDLALEERKKIQEGLKTRKNWADKGRVQAVKDKDKYTRGYERDRSKSLVSDNKGVLKRLEKLDKIEKPLSEPELELKFTLSEQRGNRDIILNDLVVGYKDVFETKKVKDVIRFAERVRITGDNAKGKTTLLKTILKKIEPLSGDIRVGNAVKYGYIPQDNIFLKDEDRNIEEVLSEYISEDYDMGKIYSILNNFNIKYYEKDKKISSLSPGERTRLKLAEFQLKDVNCLVFDEISNHLDIEAIEAIEEAIKDFKGTIITVSHDRMFLENLNIEKEIDIETGKIKYLKDRNEELER